MSLLLLVGMTHYTFFVEENNTFLRPDNTPTRVCWDNGKIVRLPHDIFVACIHKPYTTLDSVLLRFAHRFTDLNLDSLLPESIHRGWAFSQAKYLHLFNR
jgi:hypothetical protein